MEMEKEMEKEKEKKKMKMSIEPQDRLSELPDSLIFNIFELLPMNDVVRTQILSHRWETLWTLTPFLNFENDKDRDNKFASLEKFRNFVNRFLICWRGKRIQKFKVSGPFLSKSLFNDLDLWVRFAVDNGVQELILSFCKRPFDRDEDEYCVPKCLFSCSSLQKLSTFVSIMEIKGNIVQWNQLKSLEIVCYSTTQHAVELVMSKCPVLEIFSLSFEDKDNLSLSFRSSSLKSLLVFKRSPDNISEDTELRICTLILRYCQFAEDHMMDHLGAILSQILPAIRHVKNLTLSDSCIQVLGAMAGCSVLSPFSSVMFLSLNIGRFAEQEQIVGLLESFPKLHTLVVQEEASYNLKIKKMEFNPSKSFLEELRTVKVTWTEGDFSIFQLIKTLLKYASKLEKMVIQAKRIPPSFGSSDSLLSALQTKLLRMPRSSPNAKLIFCED